MVITAAVLLALAIGFWFGYIYGKTHYRRRKAFLLRSLVTLFALLFSALALLGLVAFISPSLFIVLMEKLPTGLQEAILLDIFLRGGTGFWVFLIFAGILWWVRTLIH